MNLRLLLCSIAFLIISNGNAQVGIGNTSPQANLDITASSTTSPANNDGVLIPRMSTFPTAPGATRDGMLIFYTGTGSSGKGFYYWNQGTGWVFLSSGGKNTLDQAYDEGGVGNGRIINATDGAVTINGEDGLLITGTFGVGETILASNSGARMFFNPRKAAFRAGYVNGTNWDDANVGAYSTALGYDTRSLGDYSTALGILTDASGFSTTALGYTTEASGNYSTAFGRNSTASGEYSTAFGNNSTATGEYSTAFGDNTTTSGEYSTSFGRNSRALGDYSTSFGYNTVASGTYSTAFGRNSTASGNDTTTFGYGTEATGVRSTSFGSSTEASGAYSTSFGSATEASGNYSTVFGRNTEAPSYAETTVGLYSTIYTPSSLTTFNNNDRLFSIGNGTSSSRSNALTIYKNGLMNINDEYNMPLTDGINGQVLTTDGSGQINFTTLSLTNTQNTLDQAYDEGGSGAGRTINVDNGRVTMIGESEMLHLSSSNIDSNNDSTLSINSYLNGNNNNGIYIGLWGTNPTSSPNIGVSNAINNYIRHSTVNGITTGLKNSFILGTNSGMNPYSTGFRGVLNDFYSVTNANGKNIGIENLFSRSSNLQIGIENNFRANATLSYGVWNHTLGNLNSEHIGVYNQLNNITGTSNTYGVRTSISGWSTGIKYGSYIDINSSAGGTHYGIYSNVTKSNSYAGYFRGRMSLGTGTTNRYLMPDADGTSNQVLTTNGAGVTSWSTPTEVDGDVTNELQDLTLTGDELQISSGTSANMRAFMNPKYPDGFANVDPITFNDLTGVNQYTVPAGKNLYITNVFSDSNFADLTVDGSFSILSGQQNTANYQSINNPIIVGSGSVVEADLALVKVNGFLVDAYCEPININATYTVPAGKILVILNYLGFHSDLTVASTTVYNGSGTNNNAGFISFINPIFVDTGEAVSSSAASYNINGYLIDK